MTPHHRIDYIEFGAADLAPVKAFYARVFGWAFTDYGPDYTSFTDARISGGFTTAAPAGASPLVVLFSDDLEATRDSVRDAGGVIARDIFSFPGGRRFEFTDPAGNRLAVWGHDPAPGGQA